MAAEHAQPAGVCINMTAIHVYSIDSWQSVQSLMLQTNSFQATLQMHLAMCECRMMV